MVSSFKLATFFGFEELGNPVGLCSVSVHFGMKASFTRFCIKCTSKLSESSQNLQCSPYVSDFFSLRSHFQVSLPDTASRAFAACHASKRKS